VTSCVHVLFTSVFFFCVCVQLQDEGQLSDYYYMEALVWGGEQCCAVNGAIYVHRTAVGRR
jgi:hypothetical protein